MGKHQSLAGWRRKSELGTGHGLYVFLLGKQSGQGKSAGVSNPEGCGAQDPTQLSGSWTWVDLGQGVY